MIEPHPMLLTLVEAGLRSSAKGATRHEVLLTEWTPPLARFCIVTGFEKVMALGDASRLQLPLDLGPE